MRPAFHAKVRRGGGAGRSAAGGGTEGWPLTRQVMSRGGSLYAGTVLGLGRQVRDLTGGYKCFHRRVLEALDLEGQVQGRDRVHQAMWLWMKTSLATYILTLVGDATEMAHGIEGRVPMLDVELARLVTRLPMSLKIRGDVEKWVLREAVRDLLPEAISRRTKHALLTPPTAAHPEALDFVRAWLTPARLPEAFDPAKVSALLERLPHMTPEQRALHEPALMMTLSLTMLSEAPP